MAKLSWHMRGSLSYDDAYMLGPDDKEVISKLATENLETAQKTGQPSF